MKKKIRRNQLEIKEIGIVRFLWNEILVMIKRFIILNRALNINNLKLRNENNLLWNLRKKKLIEIRNLKKELKIMKKQNLLLEKIYLIS